MINDVAVRGKVRAKQGRVRSLRVIEAEYVSRDEYDIIL